MEFVCYTDLFPIKAPPADALAIAEPTAVSAARVMTKGILRRLCLRIILMSSFYQGVNFAIRDFVGLNSKLT
jgi:hypothetical protein